MKHIFELRMKDQIEERSSQLLRNLSSCEKKAWKKFRLERDSNPVGLIAQLCSNCEDLSSVWSFIRSSNICFIYLHSFIHPSRVYHELTIWPAPSWLDSSVGRALHRHRRGHGFESHSSLNFFQAFFSQLLKLRSNCEDLSSLWYCAAVSRSSSQINMLTVLYCSWFWLDYFNLFFL